MKPRFQRVTNMQVDGTDANEGCGRSTLPTSTFPELPTSRILGHQKNAAFSGHEASFSACCPKPCAMYKPMFEINSCHSYHSLHPEFAETPTICLICMQVMKIKCEMLRKALNLSSGLNSWPLGAAEVFTAWPGWQP